MNDILTEFVVDIRCSAMTLARKASQCIRPLNPFAEKFVMEPLNSGYLSIIVFMASRTRSASRASLGMSEPARTPSSARPDRWVTSLITSCQGMISLLGCGTGMTVKVIGAVLSPGISSTKVMMRLTALRYVICSCNQRLYRTPMTKDNSTWLSSIDSASSAKSSARISSSSVFSSSDR